jgi:hypothetical protein
MQIIMFDLFNKVNLIINLIFIHTLIQLIHYILFIWVNSLYQKANKIF